MGVLHFHITRAIIFVDMTPKWRPLCATCHLKNCCHLLLRSILCGSGPYRSPHSVVPQKTTVHSRSVITRSVLPKLQAASIAVCVKHLLLRNPKTLVPDRRPFVTVCCPNQLYMQYTAHAHCSNQCYHFIMSCYKLQWMLMDRSLGVHPSDPCCKAMTHARWENKTVPAFIQFHKNT